MIAIGFQNKLNNCNNYKKQQITKLSIKQILLLFKVNNFKDPNSNKITFQILNQMPRVNKKVDQSNFNNKVGNYKKKK